MSATQLADHKATLSRLNEAHNSGDVELVSTMIDEIFQPDVLIHTPLPIEATGAEAQKEVLARLHRAFPDLHVAVEDMIAEGDKVVCRNTVTGTHRGEYLGVAPTGKSITYSEIFIVRFVDDRIAEGWGVVDVAAQLRQLGVLPARPS
ncbi:ester cyclase [Streptomyces litchfieldiae]|uniref:Ester cyclase n=1 Tax=Streptomyces litchfieldiae TaxID=3075543 RepID=A0ABU2MQL0_9ACTN|nr:ester cyclase [Streptomyces sp. DSM 44938]MDT0343901.1 ester cyclase [Streptomyces sp. DSM 44938]